MITAKMYCTNCENLQIAVLYLNYCIYYLVNLKRNEQNNAIKTYKM